MDALPTPAEIFAALPVATIIVDPTGRIAQANAAAEHLLNTSERSMLRQPLATVLVTPDLPYDGQAFAAYDTEITTARATLRVDLHQAQLPDRPDWRLITLHAAASRHLGHADRGGARAAVGAAAMLAHEIRNPLSGIRGAAQLLGAEEPGGELSRLIVTEVDRIATLIDRMEDFSDTRPLPTESANIYPILDHARTLALAGVARGVAIAEQFDPSLPAALVNRDALTQILLNLLKNAAEAVRDTPAPQLRLTTAYRHGLAIDAGPGRPRRPLPIEICVSDNGPGAPADIADYLFDPFVSGRPEGQGLGLALVDKLVRDLGGVVQYAREGEPPWTVLRLLLPRADRVGEA